MIQKNPRRYASGVLCAQVRTPKPTTAMSVSSARMCHMNTTTPYIVGLDLGNYSVGMAAFRIDDTGLPTELLHAVSHIHDAGVGNPKTSESRRSISGTARRARRRYRHRTDQREAVAKWLSRYGFPKPDLTASPWESRARLVSGVIADEDTFSQLFSNAVSHIARHRGWRNPYATTRSLHNTREWSEFYAAMAAEVGTRYPEAAVGSDPTPGQLIHAVLASEPESPVRGMSRKKNEDGTRGKKKEVANLLCAYKLHQSDNARELLRIFEVQRIESIESTDGEITAREAFCELIDTVFHQESPRGSAEGRVGPCSLVPSRKRVWRADPNFQQYRVAAQLANTRKVVGKQVLSLSVAERSAAYDLLTQWHKKAAPSWEDVGNALGFEPGVLRPPTDRPDDGEDLSGAPMYDRTHATMWTLPPKLKAVREFYRKADAGTRRELVYGLFYNGTPTISDGVSEFLANLDSATLEELDNEKNGVSLEDGRAAYGAETCRELASRMASTEDDLFAARTALYNLPRDWSPRASELTTPTGNAAVDRSLRQVNKMLCALEDRYGAPVKIVVENGRDGLTTAKTAKSRDDAAKKRGAEREKSLPAIAAAFGVSGRPSTDMIRRFEVVTRQNGACFYCGATVSPRTVELDHLVPQAGPGSTTTRENIVGACHNCNTSKTNTPVGLWLSRISTPGTSLEEIKDRIKHWSRLPGESDAELRALAKKVTARLRQKTIDPGIDARSTASTSWMATEVRRRLIQRYADRGISVDVLTFGGATTAEARRTWVAGATNDDAVSVNTMIEMAGGMGKQRLDRRHHALDAAVITVMSQYAAQVLAERRALRSDARLGLSPVKSGDPVTGGYGPWREYRGSRVEHQAAFKKWCARMVRVIDLFRQALDTDTVAVTRNLRVRLGGGAAHADTVRPLERTHTLRRPWSLEDINLVADPRVYTALIRQDDMDWSRGLPPSKTRVLNIQGTNVGPRDEIALLPKPGIAVRGGWSELGAGVHHMRFYSHGEGKLYREKVYNVDLASKHLRHQNLLTVELPESSASRRFVPGFTLTDKGRAARRNGDAVFLGSVLLGDELVISEADALRLGEKYASVNAAQELLGPITSWLVVGATSSACIQLTPYRLAREGVGAPHGCVESGSPAAQLWENMVKINGSYSLKSSQFKVPLSTIGKMGKVDVVRRNPLGEPHYGESGLASYTLIDAGA